MRSKLFRSVVGVGIALGAGGCFGRAMSSSESEREAQGGDTGGAGGNSTGGNRQAGAPGSAGSVNAGSTASSAGSSAQAGSAQAGSAQAGTSSLGGFAGSASALGGSAGVGAPEGGAAPAAAAGGDSSLGGSSSGSSSAGSSLGGSAAASGSAGDTSVSGSAGSSAAGSGGSFQGFDPFCDASWPTTKGSPPRPTCVDPDGQCDANDWTRCAGVLGPHQCDINRRDYSPYCIDGEWFCLPGMIDDFECNCWGEAPEGKRCSESGWTPIEDGAGGATP